MMSQHAGGGSLRHGPFLAVARVLEAAVVAGMFLLVVDVLWGVLTRYALGAPSRWTDEVATTLLVWVSLLGSALAYRERSHLGVDYLAAKLDPSARRVLRTTVHLLVIGFALGVMVAGGLEFMLKTFRSEQVLPALGVTRAVVYLPVPLSGLFIGLFAAEAIWWLWRQPQQPAPAPQGTSGA
jgi:TRAP-type C4-dicarboxylate transport system permease small subunit